MTLPPKGPPILNVPSPVGSLIVFTVIVHAAIGFLSTDAASYIFFKLAFIPGRVFAENFWTYDPAAFLLAPVGYALLHADWVHLSVNMAWLLVFGSAVARRMSPAWFLLFYVIGALAGAITMLAVDSNSVAPMIGASAAVAAISGGLISVALRRSPDRPPPPRPFDNPRTAVSFVAVYLALNVVFGVVPAEVFNVAGRIAWEAHLGGFAVGFLLMPMFDGRGKYR